MMKNLNETNKKVLSNTAYTMGGSLLLNGMLQLLVYPLFHRVMGQEQLGILLYIMGLVAILCPSVGQALNASRLVVRRDHPVTNGDYDILLLLFSGAGSLVCVFTARHSFSSAGGVILTVLMLVLTSFRYYGDVEYRLNLNYRRFFIYYAVITGGYLAGFVLYLVTGCWYLVFLTGEALGLLYLGMTGTVFHDFFRKSKAFSTVFRRGGFLVFSYLITNLTLNMDRVALEHMIGPLAVTQYYVTSLIGKTLVLLVAPVNIIIISYLTKTQERLHKKQYLTFVGIGAAVSAVFLIGAQIGTPLFVWLFYRDLLPSVRPLVTIVNLSQILGLFAVYLFIVVLTFAEEKWQLILQIGHLILTTGLVLVLTKRNGIMGFSTAVLIANAVRVAAVICLGIWKVQDD